MVHRRGPEPLVVLLASAALILLVLAGIVSAVH